MSRKFHIHSNFPLQNAMHFHTFPQSDRFIKLYTNLFQIEMFRERDDVGIV